ncbi:hypothetical protein [Streptomyces sp. NBC_01262]|uniref:hypothetical protein n=1 Tax=Streptomyces sp. NBC_01262 TaxID=2903803 RepID=UPI002E3010BA|nr:hypothetical protein [Streptomyces sp. NBC_01262]
MSDGFGISHAEVAKLGRSFATHAYDLEQYARAFEAATGFGDAPEAREAAADYAELAEHAMSALGGIHRRLDVMGGALMNTAQDGEGTDDALARLFAPEGQADADGVG